MRGTLLFLDERTTPWLAYLTPGLYGGELARESVGRLITVGWAIAIAGKPAPTQAV